MSYLMLSLSSVAVFKRHLNKGGGWHSMTPQWQAALLTTMTPSASQASQGTPSSCSPSIITLSHIESLKDLAQAISSSNPGGVRYGQQGTGIQVILEVDLNGRTLAAPDLAMPLELPPGLKLRLCNGSLHMLGLTFVRVGPGAELDAVRVEFRGSGQFWKGIVTVEGEGASAILHQCTITGSSDDSPEDRAHGLLVAEGGTVALQSCIVQQASECGIQVEGEGSTVSATSTMVLRCEGSGFAAKNSGQLVAERCSAHSNMGYGFLSENKGVLKAGAGCRSELNEVAGFMADSSGQLVAGEGCFAGWNKGDGYRSYASGSHLQAGAGCSAEHNGGSGFLAKCRAQLQAGPECIARHNRGAGFLAAWSGHLHAARGCSAVHNAEAGFRVQDDAKLTADPGCKAEGNGKSHDDDWVEEPAGEGR
jgi:hypothetical protein